MTGETMLIVEDDGLIALYLTGLTEKAAYRVVGSASSGEMVLRLPENYPRPDLILMDIGLARSPDGIETARRVRDRFSVPVIFATAYTFIGRLVYQKGPDLLIGAIRKVCQHRWDVQVVVAGEGGMQQFLEEQAGDLPVNVVGYIPDYEYVRLLNAADIVDIPRRDEPFGLVLLEVRSAEKCVVASNAGGLHENIDAFENGIKVYVDPESLAWGINLMTDEPENAGALGKRGRINVDRLFLRDPIARGLTDTYTRTVA